MIGPDPLRVSDEGLARVVRGDFGDPATMDPVVTALAEDIADRFGVDPGALRYVGDVFSGAIGHRAGQLRLATAMAVVSDHRRRQQAVQQGDIQELVAAGSLLQMLVSALVRKPPSGDGVRSAEEAAAVEELLCMLIYMFRAESDARSLSARVG